MTVSTSAPTHPGRELRDSSLRQLDSAARALNLDPGMHKFLRIPERTLIVPARAGSGSTRASRSRRSRASRCS